MGLTQRFRQKLAIEAAQKAGKYLLGARIGLAVEEKGRGNWVTNADRQSESIIFEAIKTAFPQDALLGEESGGYPGDRQNLRKGLWIIDPLDGTTNYVRGFTDYAVSIAYWEQEEPVLGVVFAPAKDELFVARRGEGATLNGEPIHVSKIEQLSDALLGTGFAYEIDRAQNSNVDHVANFVPQIMDLRRMGAAALDLANVAAGRLDGFWEYGLSPWDAAAGILLVIEAGGSVSDFIGNSVDLFSKRLIASNQLIQEDMIKILALGKTGFET